MWPTFAALVLLAIAWGRLERRVKLLLQGFASPSLGWEKTNLFVRVAQGLVSLGIFALIAVSFVAFGWQAGLVALFLAFVVAGATT